MNEWQNIETAPKDVTQILTFRAVPIFGKCPWFQTSMWSEQYSSWVGWPKDIQPTHWMPLPVAPKGDG